MRCARQPLRLVAALVLVSALTLGGNDVAEAALTTPVLIPQASMSGFPAGVSIYDTVNLSGASPRGTLMFSLYPPTNPTCSGAPIFVSTKIVTGNGYYESDKVATDQAGTYRWKAAYSGDANNAPAVAPCNDTTQAVTTGKRTPTLSGTAPTVVLGGTMTDTATLGMGVGPTGPTGTITFKLYGPNDLLCSRAPVFTSIKTVTGNGTYTSDPFAPAAAGTYQWTVHYSGDANNNSAMTLCIDPAQTALVLDPVPGDFDGDRKADVAVWRPANGTWYLQSTNKVVPWGTSGDIPVAGDYDGNGTTDPAVYRPSVGVWYIADGSPRAFYWGAAEDIPVPGDYDGDGKTDAAVYRPSAATWFIRDSSPHAVSWGTRGDIPVPGDYDGNGTTDIAVYRPSAATWYIHGPAPKALIWGTPGDIPVPGDYDGNGTTDLAVYRPATGTWYINDRTARSVVWGRAGDIPVPADYDGNGSIDVAVFQPAGAWWHIKTPTPRAVSWGESSDVPAHLPSAIHGLFF